MSASVSLRDAIKQAIALADREGALLTAALLSEALDTLPGYVEPKRK